MDLLNHILPNQYILSHDANLGSSPNHYIYHHDAIGIFIYNIAIFMHRDVDWKNAITLGFHARA